MDTKEKAYKEWLHQELNLQPGYQEIATWIWVEKAWNAAWLTQCVEIERLNYKLDCLMLGLDPENAIRNQAFEEAAVYFDGFAKSHTEPDEFTWLSTDNISKTLRNLKDTP